MVRLLPNDEIMPNKTYFVNRFCRFYLIFFEKNAAMKADGFANKIKT